MKINTFPGMSFCKICDLKLELLQFLSMALCNLILQRHESRDCRSSIQKMKDISSMALHRAILV